MDLIDSVLLLLIGISGFIAVSWNYPNAGLMSGHLTLVGFASGIICIVLCLIATGRFLGMPDMRIK